uniref:OsmC family protein n=1 Tax=Halomonas sp. TaxID=1486246 RepID=UPI003F8F86D7
MTAESILNVESTGVWKGGVKTEISVRSFAPFMVDEPASLGGTDEGPNPVELVLSGLSSCTSVMISLIAKEQGFAYEAAEFLNSGQIDLQGMSGVAGVSPHFQSVQFDVVVTTGESDERLQQLKAEVEKRCPVMNLFLDAKVPVTTNWVRK